MGHRPCPRKILVLLAVLVAASTSAQSRQATIDEPVFGGKAFVLEAGRGHERSVVLVHGLGEASRSWDSVVPELARDYHVLAFDLPGFGRSTRANELYDPEHYAAFVDFLVSRYVSGRFALVGHSMGGAIALRYAAAHPDKVERLVVVDAAGILHRVAYSKALVQLGIEHLPGTYPVEGRVSQWIGGLLSTLSGMSRFTAPTEELILTTPAMRQRFFQGDPNKIAGYALVLEDFSPWIPRVAAPTLVVWGAEDSIAPLRTGKLLASNIPGARLEVIPGAQHTPMESQPERFHRILADYLAIPPEDLAAGRTHGAPYALDQTVSWESDRVGRCESRRQRLVLEGEFDRIVVNGCTDVLLSAVRAREVRVINSNVRIENSVIRSEGTALRLVGSRVTLTGGSVEGRVGVIVEDSNLDIAGTFVKGEQAAVKVPEGSTSEDRATVLFSVTSVQSPETSEYVHGSRTIGPRQPL